LSMRKDLERIKGGYRPQKNFHNLYHILKTFAVIRIYIIQLWESSFKWKRNQHYHHIRSSAGSGSIETDPFVHPDRNP